MEFMLLVNQKEYNEIWAMLSNDSDRVLATEDFGVLTNRGFRPLRIRTAVDEYYIFPYGATATVEDVKSAILKGLR